MIKASYRKHILNFKQASGTSRGILKTKETWFLILQENEKFGIGECAVFRGLSADDRPDYEEKLQWVCANIHEGENVLLSQLVDFPSILFGVETAFKSLSGESEFQLFPSDFTKGKQGISINGLIWMGSEAFMKQQIRDKIASGFHCIKMKIGAIDFQSEINLIRSIRKEFSSNDIELRVDANGAFQPEEALEKLKVLSDLDIHSIEQPIKQKQIESMARLCEETPLAIALDEELIGVFSEVEKENLIQAIKPQYIILKPSLVGGFCGSNEWIAIAEKHRIGWWVTSALESNVGLNAISQYTFTKQSILPQGLGTGGLFTNNVDSPLTVKKGTLWYDISKKWNFNI